MKIEVDKFESGKKSKRNRDDFNEENMWISKGN